MTATLPFTHNRIATHLPTPESELPKSARERGKLWSDTVFQAVLALKAQLRSPDATVVMAAANAILEMERTRMRHAKHLAGSEHISEAQEEFEAEEQRAVEAQAARRAEIAETQAIPTAPVRAAPSAALAAHARGVRTATEGSGTPMTECQSLSFTASMLRKMGLQAEDVPPGKFAATMGERRAMWDPSATVAA